MKGETERQIDDFTPEPLNGILSKSVSPVCY